MLTTVAPSRSTAKTAITYCGQFGSIDADAIAFDDAADRQRRGQPIGMVLQRAEGHVRAEERQRGQLVSLSRRASQDLVERTARVIGVVGHPVVVVLQPRAFDGSASHPLIVRPPSTTMVCPVM